MDAKITLDEIAMPALLRHARYTYGHSMRHALANAGFDDIPRNGLYVIGMLSMGLEELPLGMLVNELGVSKQAAGQLVDTLVLRGYLARTTDSEDRRKLTVALTERGRAAAAIQGEAGKKIDAELLERVGPENIKRTRQTLAHLINMGKPQETEEGE